jgi:peptidoglycan/xylan/chitin deacetylase (PgdA/CDA1 family)
VTIKLVDTVWRAWFSALSPGGSNARLTTVIFHRVLPSPDPIFPDEVDAPRFDAICGWLAAWFNVLPLDEAVVRLGKGSLPPRALAITFDDGYADNHDVALPILCRHGLPATLFVATGFLDGGRMWNDTIAQAVRGAKGDTLDLSSTSLAHLGALSISTQGARRHAILTLLAEAKYLPLEERLDAAQGIASAADLGSESFMMSTDQLRAWRAAGMQVGAHTVNHPILSVLPDDEALFEMNASRDMLQQLLGEPITMFAYPNGRRSRDYGERAVMLARDAGFAAAVNTEPGVATRHTDPFQLPRFSPWDSTKARYGVRMALNFRNSTA